METFCNQINKLNFSQICRSCLAEGAFISIYSTVNVFNENFSLVMILMECTSVQIVEGDKLPTQMCSKCVEQITSAYIFKQRCEHADKMLHTQLNHFKDHCSVEDKNPNVLCRMDDNLKNNKTCIVKKCKINDVNQDSKQVTELTATNNELIELSSNSNIVEINEENISINSHQNLNEKNLSDSNDSLKCDLCEKYFIHTSHLRHHLRNHKKPKKSLDSKSTINQKLKASNITRRIRKKHSMIKEKPYRCTICCKGYLSKGALKTHSIIHGDKGFLCTECGKTFVKMIILQNHMRIHTGERPFHCTICNKDFTGKSSFNSHKLIHTDERPHHCDVCGKSFKQSGTLKTHLLSHTGEKPFSCSLCNKSFTQRNHLKYHMATHSGVKPHVCSVCGHGFTQKCNLTAHMRRHTGEMPFLCPECGKGFYDSTSMRKHQKEHSLIFL